MLILHSFWLSIATCRVRIGLDLKGVAFEGRAHELTQGAHDQPAFCQLTPAGAVPGAEGATRQPITRRPAMLAWLEATCPTPALWPADAEGRVC